MVGRLLEVVAPAHGRLALLALEQPITQCNVERAAAHSAKSTNSLYLQAARCVGLSRLVDSRPLASLVSRGCTLAATYASRLAKPAFSIPRLRARAHPQARALRIVDTAAPGCAIQHTIGPVSSAHDWTGDASKASHACTAHSSTHARASRNMAAAADRNVQRTMRHCSAPD